ncbi:MAG TPA: DNA-binding protein [Pirellulales bacterium]|nr:DNA-binding protein [Pirellulales bacterium]
MDGELLTVREAAKRLAIKPTTLYAWFGLARRGLLVLRGENVTVHFYQTGRKGQGRISIPASEVERLRGYLQVVPPRAPIRQSPVRRLSFPGIDVPLGRPST